MRDVADIIKQVPSAPPKSEATKRVCRKWALQKLDAVSVGVKAMALGLAFHHWRGVFQREDAMREAACDRVFRMLERTANRAVPRAWSKWRAVLREEALKDRVNATHMLQRVARGHLARSKVRVRRESDAAVRVQKVTRGRLARAEAQRRREAAARGRAKEEESATAIQTAVRGRAARREVARRRSTLKDEEAAAVAIQSAARGRVARSTVAARRAARAKEDADQAAAEEAARKEAEAAAAHRAAARARQADDAASKAAADAQAAARDIQRIARGRSERARIADLKRQHAAAKEVQRHARGRHARKRCVSQLLGLLLLFLWLLLWW